MRVALAVLAGIFAVCGAGLSSSAAKAEWSGWYSVGGGIVGEPSIVHFGKTSENVAVLGRGGDDALWYALGPDGVVFGSWKSLGGGLTSPPSCVSRKVGSLDCYVRGQDNAIHQIQLDGNWSAWIGHGGQVASNPAAIGKFANSTVVYAMFGTTLMNLRWTEGVGWAPWAPALTDPMSSSTTLECDQSTAGVGHQLPQGYFKEYRVLCLFRRANNTIGGFEAVTQGQDDLGYWLSAWQGSLPDVPASAYRPDVVLTGWDSRPRLRRRARRRDADGDLEERRRLRRLGEHGRRLHLRAVLPRPRGT